MCSRVSLHLHHAFAPLRLCAIAPLRKERGVGAAARKPNFPRMLHQADAPLTPSGLADKARYNTIRRTDPENLGRTQRCSVDSKWSISRNNTSAPRQQKLRCQGSPSHVYAEQRRTPPLADV